MLEEEKEWKQTTLDSWLLQARQQRQAQQQQLQQPADAKVDEADQLVPDFSVFRNPAPKSRRRIELDELAEKNDRVFEERRDNRFSNNR